MKGRRGSGGFLSNVEISSEDSDMTKVLRSLGAGELQKTLLLELGSHETQSSMLRPISHKPSCIYFLKYSIIQTSLVDILDYVVVEFLLCWYWMC